MPNKPYPEQFLDIIGKSFFAFLALMTWVCFGIMAFGVIFQWILLLIVPKDFYPYVMYAFITVWCIFGGWYWFFRMDREDG